MKEWGIRGLVLCCGVVAGALGVASRAPAIEATHVTAHVSAAALDVAPDFGACAPVVADLRDEVARLRGHAAVPTPKRAPQETDDDVVDARDDSSGPLLPKKVDWPTDLPARFEGEELRRAIEGAIVEAGVEGEITALDCSEYPCIAFGRLTGKMPSDVLTTTTKLAPYKDDTPMGSFYDIEGTDHPIAMAFVPRGSVHWSPGDIHKEELLAAWHERQQNLRDRVTLRVSQGMESFRESSPK